MKQVKDPSFENNTNNTKFEQIYQNNNTKTNTFNTLVLKFIRNHKRL